MKKTAEKIYLHIWFFTNNWKNYITQNT